MDNLVQEPKWSFIIMGCNNPTKKFILSKKISTFLLFLVPCQCLKGSISMLTKVSVFLLSL